MQLQTLFKLLSGIVSIYTLICLVRVFLTWIPNANFSPFGQFLSKICDPYLNIFKKIRFLQIGYFDLSAAVGLCVLWGISSILGSLATGNAITLGFVLAILVSMLWNIISSILAFFSIFLVIRLIVLLVSKSTYGTIWDTIDRTISPILFKMTAIFYKGRSVSFKGSLIIALIECILLYFIGNSLIIGTLIPILVNMPV